MRIVDKSEAISWLSSRGLTDPRGRVVSTGFARQATYSIPPDSGAKTAIARELAYHFRKFEESMLWVDEFGIFPSAENWDLFDGFRRSLGEDKPLWERPGHVIIPGDADAIFSLLSLVLYFVWGAVLACSSGDLVVRISHDEMIDVYAKASVGLGDDIFGFLRSVTGDPPP